jgi:Xaa-Pro dipeptidase
LNKIAALKKLAFSRTQKDAFLIFNSTNLTYFAGFSGATALLIPQDGESSLYVSGVNFEQAKAEVKGLTVELLKRGENLVEKIVRQTKASKYLVDSLPIETWRALAKSVGGEEKLELAGSLIRDLRQIKDAQEIKLMRQACKLTCIGMQVAAETVRPGVGEKDVAAEIEYAMRAKGSDGTAFETIVASGAYSAFPHGGFLDKTMREGDLVIVDLGATFKFYRSDMTRTFAVGKASDKQQKIYQTVKEAQQKAFEAMEPNKPAKDVDATARQCIERAGFGEFFVHNLGHGVGLEVHEAPILSPDSRDVLAAGNVVTDEPGIYLPGYGGVRIEDTVLVTKEGSERLTVGPYALETTS